MVNGILLQNSIEKCSTKKKSRYEKHFQGFLLSFFFEFVPLGGRTRQCLPPCNRAGFHHGGSRGNDHGAMSGGRCERGLGCARGSEREPGEDGKSSDIMAPSD